MKIAFEVSIQLLNLASKFSSISFLRNFSKPSSTIFCEFFNSWHYFVVKNHEYQSISFKVLLVTLLSW